MDFDGQVALVTGASRGIGKACIETLAGRGAAVIINYVREEAKATELAARIAASGGRAFACRSDVTSAADVEAMVAEAVGRFGQIDILVNNAGAKIAPVPFTRLNWDDFESHWIVQVRGAFNCTQAVLKHMLPRKRGKIVNVLSTYVLNVPPPSLTAYITAKQALYGLSRSLAVELGPQGIQVNTVAPGLTETDLTAFLPAKYKEMMAQQNPSRRIGLPEDVAEAVAFLASDAAGYLNGVNLPVCGGSAMA